MKHLKLFEQFVNEANDVEKQAKKLVRKLNWGRNDLKSEYTDAANRLPKGEVLDADDFFDAFTKAVNKAGLSDLITNLRKDGRGYPEGELGKFSITASKSWDGGIFIALGSDVIAATAGKGSSGAPIYAPTQEAMIDMYIDILDSSRDTLEQFKNL